LAILGGKIPLVVVHYPDVSVSRAGGYGGVKRALGKVFHEEKSAVRNQKLGHPLDVALLHWYRQC
jgi:hypothetical protein